MAAKDCKPLPPISPKDIARFWSHVDVRGINDCWEWKSGRNKEGYGLSSVKGVQKRASRIAYLLGHGKDPFPYDVLHSCDNPPCCNWRHLSKGTKADNAADCLRKGRQIRGLRQGHAKYTDEQVAHVNALLRSHDRKTIAEMTGVKIGTVCAIAYGVRHVRPLPKQQEYVVHGGRQTVAPHSA